MVVEIVESVYQYFLMLPILTCPIKIKSSQNFVISLGVVLDYCSDLDNTLWYNRTEVAAVQGT
jgi:hypothetical protein